MKLRFQWKLISFFISLSILLLLFQSYLTYSLKEPPLLASLLSLLLILPIAYLISRLLTQPIQRMLDVARRLYSGGLERGSHLNSADEFVGLSKAISNMSVQLREKIVEVTKEKESLQTILKGMMEGVLVVDGRGRISMVNDALRKLLSLASDVTDKMPLEVIRNAELEGAIRKVMRDGGGTAFELNLPSSSGKTFEVNVVGIQPFLEGMDKTGEETRGAIAVFHDITRLKELEKIRQDFVANVSHELRTPLTTIKGYAETLLEGALKEEVAFQFVQVINRHTDRLTKIVEDLLTLSKIESKEFKLKLEDLSLADLVNDAIDYVRGSADKRRISFSSGELAPNLFVRGDRNYLEQVLINLLDNAIKYGREDGTITISAIKKDEKEIQISVQDDGVGIPKEDLSRIFERFYRVDKGRSQEMGGTGLGLSIVKHIVQAHEGRVWAESQVGKGSTFHFILPINRK